MTQIRDHDLTLGFATRAVHAGQQPDPMSGAVMTPIYQTSTYAQEGLGRHKGYEYARTQNPTREALERNIASLEGGRFGFAFGSGLAALDAILKLFKAGDHVICGFNVYGGSHRLMERLYTNFGLTFSFADMRDIRNVERAITPGHAPHLRRDAYQPDDAPLGSLGPRRPGAGARLPLRGGQHLRHALLPAAARRTVPTSCSTPPPSTSTATAT